MTLDPHTPTCAGFDPHPRPVTERLPRGSCDTHFHLFGPYQSYPLQPKRGYTPPEASLDDYRRMCGASGIERAVLVQPSIYGADVSQLLDVLRSNRNWLCDIANLIACWLPAQALREQVLVSNPASLYGFNPT